MNTNTEVDKEKSETATGMFYRATVEGAHIYIKSLLILNGGALVSILISIVRTDNGGIAVLLIDKSSNFWWGLAAALIGSLFFMPVTDISGEFENLSKKYTSLAVISFSCFIFSLVMFLYGSWHIIDKLGKVVAS